MKELNADLKNIMKRGLIPKFASKISNKTNDYENKKVQDPRRFA